MTGDSQGPERGIVGAGYVNFQLAKALRVADQHLDPELRARATARASRWHALLDALLSGQVAVGSRQPIANTPIWVTLGVATGGFATGELLAGGPLTAGEERLAASIAGIRSGQERLDLNQWHLSDAGLAHLQEALSQGRYLVRVPEEAALLVVAWLASQGRVDVAHSIIDVIVPFFDRLRFFPEYTDSENSSVDSVHVFDVRAVRRALLSMSEQLDVAKQKYAATVRLPLYDQVIARFLETYRDGWPCRTVADGWPLRAESLAAQIDALGPALVREQKDRPGELFALFLTYVRAPHQLEGRQVGRIRRIVDDFVAAHGHPDSEEHQRFRQTQAQDVAAPPFHTIGALVASRLERAGQDTGLSDFGTFGCAITRHEARTLSIPEGTELPQPVRGRLGRCQSGSIAELVEADIITSGDTMARFLPVATASVLSAEFSNTELARLYAATYRAFRQRRSLLLLNLASQAKLNELPWVAAVDGDRVRTSSSQRAAYSSLQEAVCVALNAFPHAILPNKLVKELRALALSAALDIPLVEEVAADIFMGEFTNVFVRATRHTCNLVAGTPYARYYAIEVEHLRQLPIRPTITNAKGGVSYVIGSPDALYDLAVSRTDRQAGGSRVVFNGAILEQAQILTSHNLAALFDVLDLRSVLAPKLAQMSVQCFRWIIKRQRMVIPNWHGRLIMIKNTAYAWRQMLFFLSMLDTASMHAAFATIQSHYDRQPDAFKVRFDPVMRGLAATIRGDSPSRYDSASDTGRIFLGWSHGVHWLMP